MSAQDGANVDIAKHSFDVLIKVFELGSGLSDASEILKISGSLASALPVVGAILALVGNILPNAKHEEILSRFNQLSTQIDRVRDDIKNLGDELGWQQTENAYRKAVNNIELGIRYCRDIGRVKGQNRKRVAKDRLKRLCADEKYKLDLNNLLKGIAGKGLLTSESILDKFDEAKAEGHRKKISPLATRLLQVATGGILVISTYEAMLYGEKEAKQFIKDHEYISQLEDACRKAQSVLDRCVEKFRANMLVDIDSFLDKGGSNQNLVSEIRDFMSDKYDWLENFVLVYDDVQGFENHCIGGHYVHRFHHNGKCGVVFYRRKDETPRFSYKYDEAYRIVDEIWTNNAEVGCRDIETKMAEKGIRIIGKAVINTQVASWFSSRSIDIRWGGTFSTKTVTAYGKLFTKYYSEKEYGATKIVLLQ